MDFKVIGVMLLLLGLLAWRYENVNEQRITAQISAVAATAQLKGLKDNIAIAKELNAEFGKERAGYATRASSDRADIDRFRQQAENLSKASPKNYGDDYSMRVSRVLCQFSAQGDYAAEQRCVSAAREEASTSVNTITITPEVAETYKELCEDGQQDFCDWSRTGWTTQGGLNHLSDLQAIVSHSLDQKRTIDYLYKIIDKNNKSKPTK